MKKFQFILIIFIVLLCPKVFADNVNITNQCSATQNGATGKYGGEETYLYGSGMVAYNFGTRYNGRLSSLQIFTTYNLDANKTYTFTFNMATEDFRNRFGRAYWWDCDYTINATNQHYANITYISYKKVTVSITSTENMACLKLWLRSRNDDASIYITGDNNWNLSSVYVNDPDVSSGGGSGGGSSSPAPTPTGNQAIIENNNENTNNIIENNNENTNNIIENNNENTDKIIDNQNNLLGNKCPNTLDLIGTSPSTCTYATDRKSVSCTGFNNDTYFLIKNMTSPTDNDYTLSFTASGVTSNNIRYTVTGGTGQTYTLKNGINTVIIPKNTTLQNNRLLFDNYGSVSTSNTINFSNFILTKGNKYIPFCEYGSFISKIDETNSFLTDDSDPFIDDSDFTSLFNSISINNPLSSLLQLPVQFINALVSQSNSCQVVNLGTLLGVPITLPCIDIGSILGTSVWTTIDILSSIGLIVLILKQLYDSITNALTLGGYMDAKRHGLGYMPPLEFLCDILTGFGGDKI